MAPDASIAKNKPKPERGPAETFAYAPGEDKHLRVVVDSAITSGAEGYNPDKPGWLQLHVTVTNVGKDVLTFQNVSGQLASGQTVAPTADVALLGKGPPEFFGSGAKGIGVVLLAENAGMVLAAPVAMIGGLAAVLARSHSLAHSSKRQTEVIAKLLKYQTLTPGAAASGDVYLPAASGMTGLIALYSIDFHMDTLAVKRTPQPDAPAKEVTNK